MQELRSETRASPWKAIAAPVRHLLPFVVHADGYGFVTVNHPTDLSLHAPVVGSPALDSLHARLWAQLRLAGAEVAGWSMPPDHWSPHLTLIDRALDPQALGAAATWLARQSCFQPGRRRSRAT